MDEEEEKNFVISYEFTHEKIQARIHNAEVRILSKYYDLAYVAGIADKAIVAPSFYKGEKYRNIPRKEYEKLYEQYKEYSKQNLSNVTEVDKKIGKHADALASFFKEVRTVYPEFCQDMGSRIPKGKFEQYKECRNKLKQVVIHILPGAGSVSPQEVVLEQQDKISAVIDTQEFTKACQTEDGFVLSELQAYLGKVAELPQDQRNSIEARKIEDEDGNQVSVIDYAEKMKADRENRLKKCDEILKLYAKQGIIELQLASKVESDKEEFSAETIATEFLDKSFRPTTPTAPGAPRDDGNR